jgi:uncharacterized protein DUF3300
MKLGAFRRYSAVLKRVVLCGLIGWTGAALADAVQAQAQENPAAQEAAAAPAATVLGPEELRKLVAPIALYPDELLAVVLPASTNPLQVVQAQRYLDKRKADQKLQPNSEWDPAVLALLNYPEIVSKMNDDLQWTEDLGNAVVDQQKDVMDMIQQIRAETYAGGYLKSNDKQTVVQEKETIIIQSSDPEYIYVPSYDPQVVYVQNYAAYPPPYYAAPYPYYYSPAATFFAGAFVGAAFSYGFNWGGGDIDINYGSGCCGGGNNINIGNDVNIGSGNRVDHRTSDRFNADRQRVNGGDKMKWNGNKARQNQGAAGRQRAGRNTAGALPAGNRGTGAKAKQTGRTAGAVKKNRAGDLKGGGNRSSLGNYQSGRDASKLGNQGKRSKQSLQNSRSRSGTYGGGGYSAQTRSKQKAGAFGGYGRGGNAVKNSNRGRSSFTTSGRSRGGGGGRRR